LGKKPVAIYPFNRKDPPRPLHTGPQLSRSEGHQIFKEMVRAELRNGPLAPHRRKRLIQYAAALQLKPLEASRIITSICRVEGMESTVEKRQSAPLSWSNEDSAESRLPVGLMIIIPLAAVFLLDRLLHLLF